MTRPVFYPTRRGGRVVECGGLENRLACIRSRGFESLLLRQFEFRASSDGSFFCYRSPVQKQEEGFEPVGVRSWANVRAFAAQHARREGAAALPARSAGDIPPYPSVCLCSRCVKGLRRGDRLQTTYRQGFPRRSWRRAGRWRMFPWPGRLPCRRALGFRPLPQTCDA